VTISEKIRRQLPLLSVKANGQPLCYLDNAATTPLPSPILDSMIQFETQSRANVSRSGHFLAGQSDEAYLRARKQVAAYINATSVDEVIFTSGTTMSINLLANSLALQFNAGDEILISEAEHHSNYIPWQMLRDRQGLSIKIIPVSSSGRLDLSSLDTLLTERCKLVALTHASNVTGAITDIKRISTAARQVGARVLLDGAQYVSHGPLDIPALDVDFYAFSGHKCFGPTGIGVIWGKQSEFETLEPFFGGGGMVQRVTDQVITFATGYQRFEAGTPPISQAVGLGAALSWLQALPWRDIRDRQQSLYQNIFTILNDVPGLRIVGPMSMTDRLPIFSFTIDNHHAHDICHLMDQQGIALRGGHHCAQPLMDALDLTATIRASFSLYNNEEDIQRLANGLHSAILKLES
jgi:cysteine desulfurase / selenocysteine lyase